MNTSIRTICIVAILTLGASGMGAQAADNKNLEEGDNAAPLRSQKAPDCARVFSNTVLRARRIGHSVGDCSGDSNSKASDSLYADSQSASSDMGDGACDREYRNGVLRSRGIGHWECVG